MNDAEPQGAGGSGSRWEPAEEASAHRPTEPLEPRQQPVAVDPEVEPSPQSTASRARTAIVAASAVIVSAVAGAAVGLAVANRGDPAQETGGRVGQQGVTGPDGTNDLRGGYHGGGRHR